MMPPLLAARTRARWPPPTGSTLLPLLVAESQAGMALGHALGRLDECETNSRTSRRRPLREISGGKPIAPEAATRSSRGLCTTLHRPSQELVQRQVPLSDF